MMLEYLYFDYGFFGIIGQCFSFLQEFLEFVLIDEQYIVEFLCLYRKIVEGVVFGVKYLYENDIVYCDLKLGNVLILN